MPCSTAHTACCRMPMRTNQHGWMLHATAGWHKSRQLAYTPVLSSDVVHVDRVIARAHSQVAERQTLSTQTDKCAAAVAGYSFPFLALYGLVWETHRPSGEYLRSDISSFACRICRYPYGSHGAASVASTYVRLQHCMTPSPRPQKSCTNVRLESAQDKRERSLPRIIEAVQALASMRRRMC